MLLDNYIEQNNLSIDYSLKDCLGDGSDGACYKIDDRRVLKLSVLFDCSSNLDQDFDKTKKAINYLSKKENPAFAKVFQFKYLGLFQRNVFGNEKQSYVLYYYILEKLNKITEDEGKVFHTLLSHEDNNIRKDYNQLEINSLLKSLSYGLDFDAKRVKLFCDNLRISDIEHGDLHPRNIMKDDAGNFKLIDFDRSYIKERV